MKTYYIVVGKQSVIFKVIEQDDGSTHHKRIEENTNDYQEYLKWVAEGNTPTPADE